MPSPSERIKLIELLDGWVAAVGSRNMLGGSEPNMADLAVYGALNSIEGVDTFKEVLEQVLRTCFVCLRALGLLLVVRACAAGPPTRTCVSVSVSVSVSSLPNCTKPNHTKLREAKSF